ncbi:hypothetical protein BDP55DRAFT_289458 [Colletotrichum godetiae]|uniref:protein S-acyltransferase n=1 Tax=Colletotrichum godetiae TaxID=1209918 RepID=A0AAJ0AG10_9PEZI|nr:uncharacterized protein BDP55DRAFT_289458 [Colletotrichum godetiae]KAK1671657.1 hypothetical protein BDP55DRAFT_289458 [Colletotrichum godetiae]
MEVIGAVASFIAIGQAVGTARHVVHIARAIPEVEALRLIHEELARVGVITNDSKFKSPILENSMLQLTESTRRLEEIRKRCIRSPSARGKDKVKKTAWFWLQGELSECRSKARDARENLQLALQITNTQIITKLTLRIESMQTVPNVQLLEDSTGTGDAEDSPINMDQKSSPRAEDMGKLQNDEILQAVTGKQAQRLLPSPQPSATTGLATTKSASVVVQTSSFLLNRCPIPCCCRCHASKPVSYNPTRWASSLVGSLNLSFNRQLTFRNSTTCNEGSCRNKAGTSMTVDYQSPSWLCSRAVQMQTLVGVTTGLRVSLRPVRIMSFASTFWNCTYDGSPSSSRETVQQWILHNGKVFPGDADPRGMTVLEWVISNGSTEVVLYLFQIWEDQILKGSYDDSWFYRAHRIIEDTPSLPDEELQVLRRILSAGELMVNASQTPLHDALSKGGFDATIRAAGDFSWAMNQRNYGGDTPLHIAARQGHLDSVKHLVHLGCDINEVNWEGCTALNIASERGHVLTVQYLIDAGSWVNATDKWGHTAMVNAAFGGHKNLAKVIQALICAGASVNATDNQNYSALHFLTSRGHDRYTTQECLRILLEAGADIELRTKNGRTPLLLSIHEGDHAGTQCLIEAGAKTTCLTSHGCGLLHEAAFYGTTELLRYLSTLNLTAANPDLLDNYGYTPWDCWIHSLHLQDWKRGWVLKLTPERQEAFVSLFISIRDRNLTADIERLLWLLQYVRDEDQRAATAALSPLIKQKEEWKQWEILGTYKTIGLQIREQMWEAAVESVEEVVDMLREKMAASPWDTKSRWDPWSETESEDEDDHQTESTGSEDEEWDDAAGDDDDEE